MKVAENGGTADILLVEDEKDVRDALAELLQVSGYRVATADNGREALGRLRDHGLRPSLIVLDLMMPVMDGWAFRREQLDDPALARIPVIVVTAAGTSALPPSVDIGFSKPLNIQRFLDSVKLYCGKSAAPTR